MSDWRQNEICFPVSGAINFAIGVTIELLNELWNALLVGNVPGARHPVNPNTHLFPQNPGSNPQPKVGVWLLFRNVVVEGSVFAESVNTENTWFWLTNCCASVRFVCGLFASSRQGTSENLRPFTPPFALIAENAAPMACS